MCVCVCVCVRVRVRVCAKTSDGAINCTPYVIISADIIFIHIRLSDCESLSLSLSDFYGFENDDFSDTSTCIFIIFVGSYEYH